MSRRPRPAVVAGLTALAVLTPVAAYAAPVTSRADAQAIEVAVAGEGSGSGRVEATFDGQERVTGETRPSPQPFSQQLVDLGVLTQQATAGDGSAAACAGVAGAGGGVIQVGDGSCLRPGDTVSGSLGDLDLEGLGIETPGDDQLPEQLRELLAPALEGAGQLEAVRARIDEALAQVRGPIEERLGDLGLVARFDAVEGRCRVDDGSPSGTASLGNARLVLAGGGQELPVLVLPSNPDPNTTLLTDLGDVLDVLLGSVSTQLREGLDGRLAELDDTALAQLRDQVVAGVRENLQGQLAPLEENLLRVTLNEQRNPTPDSIRVTALRAEVLPVAAEAIDAPLADLRIGAVGCGPADGVSVDQPDPGPPPAEAPRLPTAVSAGVAGGPTDGQGPGVAAYALLALGSTAFGAAGWTAWRRRSALRG